MHVSKDVQVFPGGGGQNGPCRHRAIAAGKSSLMRILAGEDKEFDGTLNLVPGIKIGEVTGFWRSQSPAFKLLENHPLSSG